jgi:WD40 repeat protein
MTKLVTLEMGDGDFESGFQVTVRIGEEGEYPSVVFSGRLPAKATQTPSILDYYQCWLNRYKELDKRLRGVPIRANAGDNVQLTMQSQDSATAFKAAFKNWLASSDKDFQSMREKLCQELGDKSTEIRVIIQTKDTVLKKLPWHEWDLFANQYTNAEIAVGATEFEKTILPASSNKLRILAILGNREGIDIEKDRATLESLESSEVHIAFLVEPKRTDLSDNLWKENWNLLFFAGHSTSEDDTGRIFINANESLTIEELKYGLREAINRGLQLAIFNSCDGLKLAEDLADLNIPQVIFMREPVIDQIAQAFLKSFLEQFSQGESLYLAVRHARERLIESGYEKYFPGSSWLPVIFQNPSVAPPTWNELHGNMLKQQDWGDAPDVSVFFGRSHELTTLEEWILKDNCRLVSILGLGGSGKTWLSVKFCKGGFCKGGIGKTDLSLKLAQAIQNQFDYVIWRRLLNAPSVSAILENMIKFLSNQQEINLPETIEEQVSLLLKYLKAHRCLLILDNFDAILQGDKQLGQYQKSKEGYAHLLRQVGTVSHQSCLLLTSREKSAEIMLLEGEKKAVRSLELSGLHVSEGQQLFAEFGTFYGSDDDWEQLINFYKGNPLALELAAKHIKKVFSSNLSHFLHEGKPVFGKFRDLLDWHFERLSPVEKDVMYWLAINREPVSLSDLKKDILLAKEQVSETIDSLRDQLPLEESAKGFTLQPVLIEYMTDQLIEQIVDEIEKAVETGNISLLNRYALMKARAKDYIREIQIRLILNPIWDRLVIKKGQTWLENQLKQILSILRKKKQPGYAGGNVLNMLSQKLEIVNDYDFSDLNIWQAYLQSVKLHHVNFARSSFEKLWFTQTFGSILCLAFSANGEILATGDSKNKIHLWQNGENIIIFHEHSNIIWSLAFSADGQFLASAGVDQTAKLWDIKKRECLFNLPHQASVWSVAFTSDSQLFASSDDNGIVKFWDLHNGECLKTLEAHNLGIWSIAFSHDGQFLATASSDTTIKIWDCQNYQCIQTLKGHDGFVRAIAFSPKSHLLASGSDDTTVKIWEFQKNDGDTGKFQEKYYEKRLNHSNIIRSLAFSPDGQTIASGSDDEKVRIWKIDTGECIKLLSHDNVVSAVAFNPNTQTLACGDENYIVKIWDYRGNSLQSWQGYSRIIRALAISPDGKTLISGHDDHTVRVWNHNQETPLKTLEKHTHRVLTVAFSPDGKMFASGGCDKTLRLWNVNNLQNPKELIAGNNNWIFSITFSPDSKMVACVGTDYTIKIWDVKNYQLQKTLRGHASLIWSVVFSPDGKQIATASEDTTINIWDIKSGECLNTLHSPKRLRAVAFSPDGHFLASSGGDHKVRLWNVHNHYQCFKELQADGKIMSVAFSPDGETIAGGSENATIQIWNLKAVEDVPYKTLQHSVPSDEYLDVWSVVFSLEGKTLISGSAEGTIKLWEPKTGDCKKILKVLSPYEGMNITEVTGLTDAQKMSLKELGAVETDQIKINSPQIAD